ncbi:MAG: carbon-nitrogen hydrolase family protein [Phycisphaerae bacterium]
MQFENTADIVENARRMIAILEAESAAGTRLVVFPECSLSTYSANVVRALTAEQIDAALKTVREACGRVGIYAVVGSAYIENGKRYNGAFVFGPDGRLTKRYTKMHVVKPELFEEGDALAIFRIGDVPCTIMICHDERYPEVFRIPVLAGAKVGIYISCESKTQEKWDNYRSQVIGRAVENQISIIHCNSGAGGADEGSHGHSRIMTATGKVLAEASTEVGQVIRATIRPKESSSRYAERGAAKPSLQAFWQEGLRVLREQNPDYFGTAATRPVADPPAR